jgi:hypothetical protein
MKPGTETVARRDHIPPPTRAIFLKYPERDSGIRDRGIFCPDLLSKSEVWDGSKILTTIIYATREADLQKRHTVSGEGL